MTKREIINQISKSTAVHPDTVNRILQELVTLAGEEISCERRFRIHGLGSFFPVTTGRRVGRNPKTGEMLKVPRKVRIRFRPGKYLRRGATRATDKLKMKEIASLMVSELMLYHSQDIDAGIRNNDLNQRMGAKLQDARENYLSRIPEGVEKNTQFFDEAWNTLVAKRSRALDAMQ